MSNSAPASVRTAQEPMAFTHDELLRGGVTAWVVFMVLLVCGEAIHLTFMTAPAWDPSGADRALALLLGVFAIALIAGFVSGVAMPIGLALVLPIARAMSKVRSIAAHVALYVALGLGVAGVYVAACARGQIHIPLTGWDYFAIIPATSALIAIPLAWWWTARRALRMDAGLITPRRRRPDPDAEHEDCAVDEGRIEAEAAS